MSYVAGLSADELQRSLHVSRIVKLGSNENPLGPPPAAQKALVDDLGQLHRYPGTELLDLTEAISKRLQVGDAQLAIGNGSCELIVAVTKHVLPGPGTAVISRPHFKMYELAALWAGADLKWVEPLDFSYDLDAVAEAAADDDVRLVFITNPNNPTGQMIGESDLTDLLDRIPDDVVVVLDEAYHEYATRNDFPDSIKYVREGRNVVVTRSFSKIYALAGLRVGYALGPRPLVEEVVARQLPFHVGRQALRAALAAYEDRQFVEQSRALNTAGAAFLARELEKLGLHSLPTQSNHLLITGLDDVGGLDAALQQRGVIVRPTEASFDLPRCIRVTIGTHDENQVFVEALREALEERAQHEAAAQ